MGSAWLLQDSCVTKVDPGITGSLPAACLLLGQAEPNESREAFPIVSTPGFGSRQGGKSRQLISWAMADWDLGFFQH